MPERICLSGLTLPLRGPNLLQIAMPLGGMGAGCICLNGYGSLQDFSIRNAPATSAGADRHQPSDAGFAILHLPGEGKTRLVEGPFPPEKIYNLGLRSQGYNGGGFEGLPRFRECAFTGEYPFGMVELTDPALPLAVTLTGFNPFIPLDDLNSGIPCAILEYTLHNTSDQAVPYQFSYHLSHLAWKGAEITARSQALPGLGVYYWNQAPPDSAALGSAALGILRGEPAIKARWLRGGWFDAISALWREVSTGTFHPADGAPTGEDAARDGGSLLVTGELAPGESVTYPIVIAWHFPNISAKTASGGTLPIDAVSGCILWRPFYATQWADAHAVLLYVREHYADLRARTQAFHDALFSSSLPAPVLDAVSANLAIIKSPTILRHESGDLWGWEGCFCDGGCCPGSCTHVWNYAQSIPHLFPALERTLRERELGEAMDARGHINFRAAPPGLPTTHDFHAAADGQLGGIIKVYREWQIGGDRAWLERMVPLAKRSLDFCIEQWDPRRVGLIEEPHHNTYDIEFWGPDGLCSSFYLSALAAMSALAREAGHPQDAAAYDELAQKGAQAIEARLFNGEYYQQETASMGTLFTIPDDGSDEARLLQTEGPKYQIGSGCLSDGVWGVWLAQLCGVETAQNKDSIRSHLAAVYRHNFKLSLWEHANPQRPGYALGDEPGLLLCTWPRGGKPTLPFIYSDEVWTGIEYQVAAHLIAEGLVEEGLTLVQAVRSRYNGHVRNPWNEYECGSYYARAMSSYALLIAFSGFRYAAPTRTLTVAPHLDVEPFTCFFSTASGWGALTLHADRLDIRLVEGVLAVDTLQIPSRPIHAGCILLHTVSRPRHPRRGNHIYSFEGGLMKNKNPLRMHPVMRSSHLPLTLLGAVMAGYGLLTALAASWLSSRAMGGLISAGAYRSQLMAFEQTAGLIAGILLLALFVWCAIGAATGLARVAFAIGAVASAAPVLVGRAEHLLFRVLGLPTMSAGSVVAGAVTTLVFALPMTILFILLACGRRIPRGCRWLSLASIFIVLGTAFFPIYVTVLAFLLKPGDPAVGRMIQLSSQIIKLRFLLPGLSLLGLAFISRRFAWLPLESAETAIEGCRKHSEGEAK